MAQETITDYEAVEKKRTITVCDNCGRTDEESEMVTVAINPRQKVDENSEIQLINVFDDEAEAEAEFHKYKKNEREYKKISRRGIGREKKYKTVDMKASATADVCSSCLTELFDVDVEPEEIEDIDVKNGGININTIEERISIWPDVIDIFKKEWEPNNNRIVTFGWKSKILFWPIMLPGVIMHKGDDYSNDERIKGYIAASIGAIVWFSLLFVLMFILL